MRGAPPRGSGWRFPLQHVLAGAGGAYALSTSEMVLAYRCRASAWSQLADAHVRLCATGNTIASSNSLTAAQWPALSECLLALEGC